MSLQAPYKFRTMDEMLRYHYGMPSSISKATGGLKIGTGPGDTSVGAGGINNWIYGAVAWSQVNQEANGFGILPKNPWDRSGWRMIEDRANWSNDADRNGATKYGAITESGGIAKGIVPTFKQEEILPKIIHLPFKSSTVREWLSTNASDDMWGNGLDGLRLVMAVRHKELINQMILADQEGAKIAAHTDTANSGRTTVQNWENFDAIISSKAEEDMTNSAGGTGDGWYDPWLSSIDRDAGATVELGPYDCVVESASGTLGTDGNLTDDVIRSFQNKVRVKAGKESTVYLGSHDIYNEIQGIYTSQVRYDVLGESTVNIDVNGIQTFTGIGVGIHVSTVYGIPYIPTKDAPHNGNTEVGRMFAFDTSDDEGFGYPRIGIQIAIPTTYQEIGRGMPGWPWVNGEFSDEALYWTMGETICRQFKAQAKLRDVKV